MKIVKNNACLLFLLSIVLHVSAQSSINSYTFKKGEILDILLITTKPEGKKLIKRYKETAFPVAIDRSYTFLPGFKIKKTTQGNIQPGNFLLGKWDNLKNREAFLEEIETFVPDFHEQRRSIWSIFNLVYYEIPQDISFNINKDKLIVVTAYWKKKADQFDIFKTEWIKKSENYGGKKIVELTNGRSPMGYYYNPDYLVITEWEDEAAFKQFYNKNLDMDHNGILHMNQFIIN